MTTMRISQVTVIVDARGGYQARCLACTWQSQWYRPDMMVVGPFNRCEDAAMRAADSHAKQHPYDLKEVK